jgi:hypothetical protein
MSGTGGIFAVSKPAVFLRHGDNDFSLKSPKNLNPMPTLGQNPGSSVVANTMLRYHEDNRFGRSIVHAVVAAPPVPTGKIKTFGPLGPKYQIGQALRQLDNGDWMVEITMVETGEIAEYRLSHLSDDPDAL